jgi:hypothetical protein
MLALDDHPARRWEPKRLRLRLFSIAGPALRIMGGPEEHAALKAERLGISQRYVEISSSQSTAA